MLSTIGCCCMCFITPLLGAQCPNADMRQHDDSSFSALLPLPSTLPACVGRSDHRIGHCPDLVPCRAAVPRCLSSASMPHRPIILISDAYLHHVASTLGTHIALPYSVSRALGKVV
ncbi:hypothetical protein QBC43DRAFT_81729 [Cladorrhinum sp. PSN259]|nr:hypothetical protein QBC43DRAFT_81729 [Cladorrhinum sp. PSN259]